MYCKLFSSLYQGTLRGCANEILVFTNLLAHADQFGIVDKHFKAIAEETGLSVEQVKRSILILEAPDPESRSPEADGARLQRLDGHRVWGWKIVNYGKYRAIKNEDDRREQNRLAQERWRNRHKQPSAIVSSVSRGKPPSAQAEGEGEADTDKKKEREPAPSVKAFSKPSLEEVTEYGNTIALPEAECRKFTDYYTANGWKVGRTAMKDWKAALRNWQRRWSEGPRNGSKPKVTPDYSKGF